MEVSEIRQLLSTIFLERTDHELAPTATDWNATEEYLHTQLPEDFVRLHSVVGEFWFEGELLKITSGGELRGDDTIILVYELETKTRSWPEDLVPFCAVGNGDYECISISAGIASPVFYVRHEDRQVKKTHDSFGFWLLELPSIFSNKQKKRTKDRAGPQ